MTTLVDDLQAIKPFVANGDLRGAASRMAAYVVLKPTLGREAKRRLPPMVFNHHPRFRALGARLFAWPEDDRKAWAGQIERSAVDPERLPGVVELAADAAEKALKVD